MSTDASTKQVVPPPQLPHPTTSAHHSDGDNEGETESVASNHSGLSEGSDGTESSTSYETVDLAESELYQVLSLFLSRTPEEGADENTPTENVTDVLAGLKNSVDKLNGLLQALVTATQTTTSSTSGPGSSSHRRHKVKSSSH